MLLKVLSWLIYLLPRFVLTGIGMIGGAFIFSVLRIRRRVAVDNCQRALSIPPEEARRIAKRAYQHLCLGALEFLKISRLTPQEAEKLLGEEGIARLRQILSAQRGMLVLTAHLGHWDLLACAAALAGFKVNVISRDIKATWLNHYWMEQRQHCGLKLLSSHGSARQVLAALSRNEIVAFILDQHDPMGQIVPFFSRPAQTGTGLARLARLTNAPVVPAFLVRKKETFVFQLLDPLTLQKTDHPKKDIADNTSYFNKVLEEAIRSAPEQWLWLHRRWKVDGTR